MTSPFVDSGYRMIADTLVMFRTVPAGTIRRAVRPSPASARQRLYLGITGMPQAGKNTLASGLASALALPCHRFDGVRERSLSTRDQWVCALRERLPLGGIVTGVGCPDEAAAIRALGGTLIHVSRPGRSVIAAQEGGLSAIAADIAVVNDRTPADLVRVAVERLLYLDII